jgi:hypothetical protein
MSDSNNSSSSDSDNDYDAQAEGHVGSGIEVGSGSGVATSSMLNETQANANLCPPRALAEYAKGTFDPKKPLLLYATKVLGPSTNKKTGKQSGGSCHWTCNVCGHPWVGSYSRVRQHLLGIGGKRVNVCTN